MNSYQPYRASASLPLRTANIGSGTARLGLLPHPLTVHNSGAGITWLEEGFTLSDKLNFMAEFGYNGSKVSANHGFLQAAGDLGQSMSSDCRVKLNLQDGAASSAARVPRPPPHSSASG